MSVTPTTVAALLQRLASFAVDVRFGVNSKWLEERFCGLGGGCGVGVVAVMVVAFLGELGVLLERD